MDRPLHPVVRLTPVVGALLVWLWAVPAWAGLYPFVDTDRNGLNDAWEIAYFGAVGVACPDADPDGDGLSNRAEQTLGTDPTAPDNPAGARPVPRLGELVRSEKALVAPRYTHTPQMFSVESTVFPDPPKSVAVSGQVRGEASARIGAYHARPLWVQWPTDTL